MTTTANKFSHAPRFRPQAEPLDDRCVPAINLFPTLPLPGLPAVPDGFFAVAAADGSTRVQLFNPDGTIRLDFLAYDPAFTGGVFVATWDVTGDLVPDVVTSTGPGGTANFRVFDGADGNLIASFFAYPEAFTGGVRVAVGDFDGDLNSDILTGVGSGGGPNVRLLSGQRLAQGNTSLASVSDGGLLLNSFDALPEGFTGGVYVAAGDVAGDGRDEVIVGVGSGGGANVRALDASNGFLLQSFFAFDESLTGGVRVASTDVNGDRYDDFVVGTGPDTQNRVRILSGFNTDTALRPDSIPFGDYDGGLTVG